MRLNEIAAEVHRRMCEDDRFGYSWEERYGATWETWTIDGHDYRIKVGDYDCSSSTITAWSVALQHTPWEGALDGAVTTHNMRSVFVGSGLFEWRGFDFLAEPGDLYLSEANHVVMCQTQYPDVLSEFSWGDNVAYGNKRGDQSGREASVHGYYSYPWDGILHFIGGDAEHSGSSGGSELGPGSAADVGSADLPMPRFRVAVMEGKKKVWLDWMLGLHDEGGSDDTFAGIPGKGIVDIEFDGGSLGPNGWYSKNMKGDKLIGLTVFYDTSRPEETGYYAAMYRVHWGGLIVLLASVAGGQTVYGHDEPKHRSDLEAVLFDGDDFGNKEAIERLEEAMYLCLDFNGMEEKGTRYLKNLGEYGVAPLPKPEEINLPGGSYHQRYTHRGWDAQSQYLSGDDVEKWEKRKALLINTSYKIFGYSAPPGFLSWTPLRNKELEKKCNSFCALVYYVHVLGDYVAIKDESWKSFSIYATKIPFADRNVKNKDIDPNAEADISEAIDIFSEIKKHLCILFADQPGFQRTQLLKDIDALASKARKLFGGYGGLDTPEKFAEAHGYACELMSIVSGEESHAKIVHDLLMNEEFFRNAFPMSSETSASEGWLEELISSFGLAA